MKNVYWIAAVLLSLTGCSAALPGPDPDGQSSALQSPYIGTLVRVEGGSYQRQNLTHNISIVSGFYMAVNEISRSQYTAVTGLSDPSSAMFSSGSSDPVQNVSWFDALVFCNTLSLLEGLIPVYSISGSTDPADWGSVPTSTNSPGYSNWIAVSADQQAGGYRLPTEMEWMWAAMGGLQDAGFSGNGTNTTGYLKQFAGHNGPAVLEDFAWYATNSGSTSHPSGQKTANELGIFDLSGNIYEWCQDWYETWSGAYTNYSGPATGTRKIMRGGSWFSAADTCALGFRNFQYPWMRAINIGLRVVRTTVP